MALSPPPAGVFDRLTLSHSAIVVLGSLGVVVTHQFGYRLHVEVVILVMLTEGTPAVLQAELGSTAASTRDFSFLTVLAERNT